MEKTTLLKKVFTKKTQDYTYAIAFFLIFSFFIYFIIRPNILSVFIANAKIEELKKLNLEYESQIEKVISIQSSLESNRDDLVYLNQAISQNPEINKILRDISQSVEKNNLITDKMDISGVNLTDGNSKEKLNSILVQMNLTGNFDDLLRLMRDIYNQRRLKVIKQLTVNRDEDASDSSRLKMQLVVEGYYL